MPRNFVATYKTMIIKVYTDIKKSARSRNWKRGRLKLMGKGQIKPSHQSFTSTKCLSNNTTQKLSVKLKSNT